MTEDAERGHSPHPTFGLWPVALREDLRAALAGGVRKVVDWTGRHGVARRDVPRRGRAVLQRQHARRPRARRGDAGGARAVRVYGVTGWKNSGKTTLVERLVAEITGARLQRLDAQARPPRLRRRPARARTATATGPPGARQVLVASARALGADDRAARRAGAAAGGAAGAARAGRSRAGRRLQARPPSQDRGAPRRHGAGPDRRRRRDDRGDRRRTRRCRAPACRSSTSTTSPAWRASSSGAWASGELRDACDGRLVGARRAVAGAPERGRAVAVRRGRRAAVLPHAAGPARLARGFPRRRARRRPPGAGRASISPSAIRRASPRG